MSETGLTSSDFAERGEPLALFGEWLRDATPSEPNDPNAVALASVDADRYKVIPYSHGLSPWVERAGPATCESAMPPAPVAT